MSEAAIAAVRRFTAHGDAAANQELLHLVEHALDVGGTHAAHTIAPQLLQWAEPESTPGVPLYVAVLNRHFCLRVVLDHLAQPLDRRPTGLEELQQLYLAALRSCAHDATRTQLTQCVACLMVVVDDHLVEHLCAWIRGSEGATNADTVVVDCRTALHLFVAAVDLLVDRRVPFGSIRRATQRRHLQENLAIVLQSPLSEAADMPLLLRVTATAVRFLLEAMYGEPQEVAETFWAALPSSAVWRYCIACLPTSCPPAALDFVCSVLRCLTIIDAAAEALLLAALPAVLQPMGDAPTAGQWEAVSRVIAAALEASTEAIITTQPPDAPLFQLFSAAAERLVQVLQAPAAPSTAVNHVCEGVSALTQVLQPAPLPEMEPSDDPEDFAEVVSCMQEANTTKRAALEQLRPFLAACETMLAKRLVQSGFGQAEWRSVADYVRQRISDGDGEDFQIVHEEVALALYTTYERVGRLLGPLTAEVLQSAAEQPAQQLVLVTVDGELTVQWLRAVAPAALLPQSVLLPATVKRYVDGAACRWTVDTLLAVADVLLCAVASYDAVVENGSGDVEAVLAVAEAAVTAVLAVQDAGLGTSELRERCAPLVSLLWRCTTTGSSAAAADTRHAAAGHLSSLLQRGVASLPDSAVQTLISQDAYTQALLFASAGATSASVDTLAGLAHLLDCLSRLIEREADDVQTRAWDGVVARVRRHCEVGDWPADALADVLTTWHTRSPHLVLCFLGLTTVLPAALQPSLLMGGLSRFFTTPESRDVATPDLVSMLTQPVVQPLAHTAATAPPLHALLQWLLQPHPAFTIADGGRRVRALAACGRHLCEGGQLQSSAVVDALALCVARWQEYVAATALRGPVDDNDNDDDDVDGREGGLAEGDAQVTRAVLEEMAVWGRCVAHLPELPDAAPAWMAGLQRAEDDYERIEVLKSM